MKQRHIEKEEYISRLARDKEEMKVLLVFYLSILCLVYIFYILISSVSWSL